VEYNGSQLLTVEYNGSQLLTVEYNGSQLLTVEYNCSQLLTLTSHIFTKFLQWRYMDIFSTGFHPKHWTDFEHNIKIVTVAPCMLPHLLYNPTHALFTL